MSVPQTTLQRIVIELKELADKDKEYAKLVEERVAELIKINPGLVAKKGTKIVSETYEQIRMGEDIDKVNRKQVSAEFLKQNSRIGRISYKKALDNMVWNIKKYLDELKWQELKHTVYEIDAKHIYPEDYDTLQTAKIRDEFVFLKDEKLNLHALEKGKDTIKKIGLKENTIIIIGKSKVFRIYIDNGEIDSDSPNLMGTLPLDSIYFVKSGFVFVWKL